MMKWEGAGGTAVLPGVCGSPAPSPHESTLSLEASVRDPGDHAVALLFHRKLWSFAAGLSHQHPFPLNISALHCTLIPPHVASKQTVPVKTIVRGCRQICLLIQTLLPGFVPQKPVRPLCNIHSVILR